MATSPGSENETSFLVEGGELGRLMRTQDWSATPLGEAAAWPQSLKTLVSLMLASSQPMFIAWGSDRTLLYNDAYAGIALDKHPRALGRDFLKVWAEIRAELEPIVAAAYSGQPVRMDDITLFVERRGYTEETHFSFSYTPVRNETGAVAGFFAQCIETTALVQTGRRQEFRLALEERLRGLTTPREVMAGAVEVLGRHLGANRVGYGEVQADDITVVLHSCFADGVDPLEGAFPLDSFGAESIVAQRGGVTRWSSDVLADPDQDPAVWTAIDTRAFASAPLVREGRFVASLYVNFREPHHWTKDEIALVEEVAARTWDAVERARAVSAERMSERRLRRAHRAARLGDFTWDIATDETTLSEEYLRMLGLRAEDLPRTGAEFMALIHPEDRDRVAAEAAPMLAGEAARLESEYRLIRGDGKVVWLSTSAEGEGRLPDGRVARVVGVNIDVTDRRRAAAALQETEARFRNIADNAPVMMWVTDPSGHCTYLNRSWYAFTGQPDGAGEAFGWLEAVHPEDRPVAERAFVTANAERRPYRIDFRLRRSDGAYRWVLDAAAPRLDATGEYLGYVGSVIDIDERRESELALANNEERLRLATENADVGFWDVDVVNDLLIWPPRVKGMFGISADVPVSMADFYSGLHPEDRDETAAAFAAATDPELRALYDVEYRTVGKEDGVVRWVAAKGRGVFDPDGRCVRVIGTAMDITARKQTEAALRASEARFRLMADAVPQILWVVDAEGRNEFFNRQWFDYTGARRHPITAAEVTERFIHPDDRGPTRDAFAAAQAGGTIYQVEHRIRARSGEYRWFLVRGEPDRDPVSGEILRWFGASIEIHDRRMAEQRLRELNETLEQQVGERTAELSATQRRFQAIFDSALQFMALLAPDGTVLEVNQTALAWSQIQPSDIVGGPFWLAAPMRDNPPLQEAIRLGIERAAAGETVRAEHEMRGAGEVRATIDFSLKPVFGERGEVVWLVAEGRDITELKTAQEALRQSQKMEAMGQLTGGVAHDFNNLLTPIVGSLDMLMRRGVGNEREQRLITGAMQSAERAKTLVQRLLAFARRQPLQASAVDVPDLVKGMAGLIGSTLGPKIDIRVELAEDLPAARADANQLEMALLNLAVNARDAMPDGGALTISGAEERVGEGHRAQLAPGDYVRLSVADTGVGMDSDTLRRAVEPFYSTKGIGKGTGLGLSMVHGLAAQLGGGLAIASEPGHGTVVELWLPVDPLLPNMPPVARPHAPEVNVRGRALLVDDEDLVRMSTADMLADLGYEVVEAGSGEEALTQLRSGFAPDLLVTDHLMPGISGVELAREARMLHPALPILIVSGYAEVDGIAADLPRLTKPFRNAELAERILELS